VLPQTHLRAQLLKVLKTGLGLGCPGHGEGVVPDLARLLNVSLTKVCAGQAGEQPAVQGQPLTVGVQGNAVTLTDASGQHGVRRPGRRRGG
jgi:hypothetical protein